MSPEQTRCRLLRLLMVPALMVLHGAAAATPADERAGSMPVNSCTPDPYLCPDWMPSQARMRSVIADYFCEQVDNGRIIPAAPGQAVAESSTLSCAALNPEVGGNFVCGGELGFIHADGSSKRITFSPTLHYTDNGRIAFYQGDDEAGKEVWHVPAARSTSRYCSAPPARR